MNCLISIVTPVFNAVSYLPATYHSLCRQTYGNWQWVVVSDGSTDGSDELLQSLASRDSRIVFIRQRNYGNAKYTRDHAIAQSSAQLVVCLDADDSVPETYLQQLLSRQQSTDADIVYPQLAFIDDATQQTTQTLPAAGFDLGQTYCGRDLVRLTLPDWQIGCNGGMYKKGVFSRLSYPRRTEPLWLDSDEVDERYYLLEARRVAFADTTYFYRIHRQSVTKRFSPKLFQTLQTSQQLIDFATANFGPGSEEYRGAQRHAFDNWRGRLQLFLRHHAELESAEGPVLQYLASLFSRLDAGCLSPAERLRYFNLASYKAVLFSRAVLIAPGYMARLVVQRLSPQLYARTL